ncbi:hypothetical protein BABINDRAFT_162876 [Babjeviella inositovora NRRL Y-12698]|uniref:Uncharacterized protein n=1 Tax=Babjeviella inositovora NRRL Y-12698 TaxID=984486 RepID=A0A1E3QM99_9ASCO|nr:uncharacterized protein BABINDRAFT_162876 [Babjeviella inositovora NRRL Y-12698]ODQ78212.1 hypothetical protein BABINDRAFT_162876 [Babjeviella inositovora NRRL Y-12698]
MSQSGSTTFTLKIIGGSYNYIIYRAPTSLVYPRVHAGRFIFTKIHISRSRWPSWDKLILDSTGF